MTIKLLRHGESLANVVGDDQLALADHQIPLTETGITQARAVGETLGAEYLQDALIYTSPFLRTRQTLTALLEGANLAPSQVLVREDPRLREVEHGYSDVKGQYCLIETYGHFYYRYQGGESPADCYDRVSSFLASFVRNIKKTSSKRALIVTHGLALRVFVMRFMHLTVEQFDLIANPRNADIITIANVQELDKDNCLFISGKWGVEGLRQYQHKS
ncbi:MAG: histidine phosphatase family protein [Cyanothece sp. SIO2G6]|nr:histidine phosphatase family protein [Cyanothece sp. SIO2G6]